MNTKPRLLITLGDVAGIGPEIIVRAWANPELHELCSPVVIGDVATVASAIDQFSPGLEIPVIQATQQDVSGVCQGTIDARAGRAAYDFICHAVDECIADRAEGMVTLPLHKKALRLAELPFPGHTEILAVRTGTRTARMMLYGKSLGIVHVTLHMAMRDALQQITQESIESSIHLANDVLMTLHGQQPRIAVCGLNPHAGDDELFGDEELKLISPAVRSARRRGVQVTGPLPSDTVFLRASKGEFDGVVAMYHDQGHIPMKLMCGYRAVNITAGLPIVRTSVAHGTAFDIAGQGVADCEGLMEAVRVGAQLVLRKQQVT